MTGRAGGESTLASKYSPAEVEGKWYQYWLDNKLFSSKPDGREPYTVVIPPPNVTGVLHMGHVLNETIQDILVRHARMEGKNACWVPGTDHASIATEAKVVNRLAEQGIKKADLTREEFLKHAWAWTEEHGGIILKQLRKLGCSCDWDRTAFTMDGPRSESVIKVFVDLYRKGLIYRGVRMVNWDPKALTALSDEEVIYKEEHTKLYYMKYYLADLEAPLSSSEGDTYAPSAANNGIEAPSGAVEGASMEGNIIHKDDRGYYAVVATTRPETIMGDVAMCINPKDPKNQWLKGRKVIVPVVGRVIPVIEDEYVDIEFGTGCLKVTPAHDVNDYMLGEKYNLEAIDIFNDDATLSERIATAQQKSLAETKVADEFIIRLDKYVGMERFACRKQIAEDMTAAGLMEKIEDYDNKIGCSERTGVPIEPKLSMQWFLKMQHFADIALDPVMNDDIQFYPAKYKNTYRHWLENIKDWCISRQLWWGHRIPAWYISPLPTSPRGGDYPWGKVIVAENEAEAYKLALETYPVLKTLEAPSGAVGEGATSFTLRQDEDALDTWFSSWLWPISLFDGIRNPGNEEISYYYPTADLVTGPDIIFFWVARMIMAGYEYEKKMPFRHVYFTGIVRDKLGRKMSKSLGNSPDPLDLIDRFGADGVRMGMMLSAPAGNDILFDESLCEQGRNFNNKIWNAFRLVKGWQVAEGEQPEAAKLATGWFAAKLRIAAEELADDFSKYRLSEALMTVYKLFWDEFSSWYLEMIKPAYVDGKQQPIDRATYDSTLQFFEILLKMMHPFMPFITEELWQALYERQPGESIMRAELHMEASTDYDRQLCAAVDELKEIVTNVRAVRSQKNIAPKEKLTLEVVDATDLRPLPEGGVEALKKMANLETVNVVSEKSKGSASFLIGTAEYAVPLGSLIDLDAERQKLESELQRLEGFLASIQKKLANERFVQNAPAAVVEMERKKQADAEQKIASIRETLASM
ncbi:MAG: valine--tRNA ligase [Bacteroidaceae bacterium]|nr:valine--tRNA ligase [Bacteroidaceae bacterium]